MKTKPTRVLAVCALIAAAFFFTVPFIKQRMHHLLCNAAIDGNITLVRICLMTHPDLNKHPTSWDGLTGFLAIDCAAIGGHEGIVTLLLENGTNPNPHSSSPLMIACYGGNYAVTKLLLEHGADPNVNGSHFGDGTPLNAATGHPTIIDLLRSYGAKE